MEEEFEYSLLESLQYGFINSRLHPDNAYSPRVLINNPDENRMVLSDIDEELRKCEAFYFSVAFVTQSGINLIKAQLFDLALRGGKGKIIISPYLDFNDPLALYDLLKLKNVEVRMSPAELQLHAKYYMFEHNEQRVIISGSSNLTATALKKNYEWNIKLTSTENGDITYRTNEEFKRVWDMSEPLTEAIIKAYASQRSSIARKAFSPQHDMSHADDAEITPNAMQIKALANLKAVRTSGAQKALVISSTGTGKTYLSAFDVKQVKPQRMLYVVHREQILKDAMKSFKKVIGFDSADACIISRAWIFRIKSMFLL
ncbi:DEAD/DEAH box helicase family protein [Alloscardovia criceti]|uniref:DEAD/DEAH box helicase family protein n=1 Tax=Alloscardovia criceti TaxID=356828 RepID=UPI0003A5C669|nr:DEAD/DEAH box helicase family protein [Alloscardovia criceti]